MSIPSKLYLRKTSIEFLMNVFLKLHFTLNDYFFVNLKKNISYKSSSFEVNFLNFSIPALAPPSDNNLYLICKSFKLVILNYRLVLQSTVARNLKEKSFYYFKIMNIIFQMVHFEEEKFFLKFLQLTTNFNQKMISNVFNLRFFCFNLLKSL